MAPTDPPPDRSRSFSDPDAARRYRQYLLDPVFEPWAADLVGRLAPRPGDRVLDVASGLGPVARRVAAAVGPTGAVEACDISAAMLAGARELDPGPPSAPISYVECPADAIGGPDGRFDAVVCQQGLQFFPDRLAALGEMRRVTRDGGHLALSSWAAEEFMPLFAAMGEVLEEMGEPEPYPAAFRTGTFALTAGDLRHVVEEAGWRDVRVDRVRLDVTWPDAAAVLDAVAGTPFGAIVTAMGPDRRADYRRRVADRLGIGGAGGPVSFETVANVALSRA